MSGTGQQCGTTISRQPQDFPNLGQVTPRSRTMLRSFAPEGREMLKTALVAMTIVGCDCDAKLCEFVSETPAQYASAAECESAVKAQTVRTPGVDYPVVTGICRTVSPSPGEENAAPAVELASLKHEDGRTLYEMVGDGGGYVWQKTADGYALMKAGVTWTADRIKPSALAALIP
jgi:hypothetical protein